MIIEFVLCSIVTRVVSPAFRVLKLSEACSLFSILLWRFTHSLSFARPLIAKTTAVARAKVLLKVIMSVCFSVCLMSQRYGSILILQTFLQLFFALKRKNPQNPSKHWDPEGKLFYKIFFLPVPESVNCILGTPFLGLVWSHIPPHSSQTSPSRRISPPMKRMVVEPTSWTCPHSLQVNWIIGFRFSRTPDVITQCHSKRESS